MVCYAQTNGTQTKSLECDFPKRDKECVHLRSAVSFSPLTIRKVLRDLLKDLSSQIRSLLKDYVSIYNSKNIRGLKSLVIYDLLHSLGSGVGFCIGFGGFACFFVSYHLLSPKSAQSQVTNLSAPV